MTPFNTKLYRVRAAVLSTLPAVALACSFQNFDDLQEGTNTEASGGSDDEDNESGGSSSSGGSGKGGSKSTGGQSGSGGDTADGGMGGEGGTDMGLGGAPPEVPALANASFETGNTAYWQVQPASALGSRHVFVQAPTGTVLAPDGTYELAFWHPEDTYQVTISQEIKGLPEGTYTLSAQVSRGTHIEVFLFARGCADEDPEPAEVSITDANSFTSFYLRGIEVDSDTCEVGLTVDAGPNDWMNVDLFELTRE